MPLFARLSSYWCADPLPHALQHRLRPSLARSPPRLSGIVEVTCERCSGSPQFTGNLSNRQPFVVPLVPDNVFAIHPQHPSLRSSSMFSNTKLSPGGLPAGGGSIS